MVDRAIQLSFFWHFRDCRFFGIFAKASRAGARSYSEDALIGKIEIRGELNDPDMVDGLLI